MCSSRLCGFVLMIIWLSPKATTSMFSNPNLKELEFLQAKSGK